MANGVGPTREQEFQDRLLAAVNEVLRHTRLGVTAILEDIQRIGGLQAGKNRLRTRNHAPPPQPGELCVRAFDPPSEYFLATKRIARMDLSIEAVALEPKWQGLFTQEEIEEAIATLSEYGFNPVLEAPSAPMTSALVPTERERYLAPIQLGYPTELPSLCCANAALLVPIIKRQKYHAAVMLESHSKISAAMPDESSESQPSLEVASVLFMDIVGFSLNPMEKQNELLGTLQQIVRSTEQFKKAQPAGNLISLPTGDGMALAFFRDPVAPVKCAIEIQTALHGHPALPLRTGVHSGPVFRHSDIQDNINIVGGGINMAQRVMDCGDAGHILISQSVAEVLVQLRDWPPYLHDLGICQVKHGARLQLYNVYHDGVGNPEVPANLKVQQPKAPELHRSRQWMALWGAAIVLLLIALYFGYGHTDWFHKGETQPAATKNALRYYVLVQKFRYGRPFEQPFRLSGERVFEEGYQVRLVITSPTENYLYVINEGPKSTADKPDLNTLKSYHLKANEQLDIPPSGFFVFDKEKGVEKLWVVWSRATIPELEALKKWANTKDRGAIGDSGQARSIMALLKKYAITKVAAQRDDANQVTILAGSGDILAYVIPLDHD